MRNRHYHSGIRLFVLGTVALLAPLWGALGHSYALEDGRYFPETGKTVKGIFYGYWLSHGDVAQQGYPISDEMQEISDTDGNTYKVQYFERSIFEAHPEYAGTPNEVLLSLLGVFIYQQKYPQGAPGQSVDSDPGVKTFPEKGHHLGGIFLAYWQTHGELAQQGYPISEEFDEVSALDGQTYKVQYFQRAVFELHPEYAGTPNEVLLSQLGTFRYHARYGAAAPAASTATPVLPYQPAATPTAAGGAPPCPPDFLDVPMSDFDGCYNYWAALGYSVVTLASYQADNVTYLGGSFQKVTPTRLVIWNMTLSDFQSDSITLKGEHYAPDQVSVLQTGAEPRFTAVWSQTQQPFQYDTGLTSEQYQQRDSTRRSQGYVNTDVWNYMGSGGARFGGTWIQRSSSGYKTFIALDLTNYRSFYDPYIQQGFQPVRFEPFSAGSGSFLSVILEKTPGTWEITRGLTVDQAQATYNYLSPLGYRLYSIRALGSLFWIVWYKP